MALQTEIRAKEFNIPLIYHRVLALEFLVNEQNGITIASYYDKATREQERINPTVFKQVTTYFADYDPTMSIPQAYEWLKNNTTEFKDAADIWDDGDAEVTSND